MSDVDASAAIELEGDSLSASLDQIAARFGAVAAQINASFTAANTQLARTATLMPALNAGVPAATGLSAGLAHAARAAQLVTIGVSGIITTLGRILPLVQFIPDGFARWAPGLKSAVHAHERFITAISLVRSSVAAVTGRLTLMQAAMTAFGASSSGIFSGLSARIANLTTRLTGLAVSTSTVQRSMVIFGGAAAYAMSRTISGCKSAISAVSSLGSRLASVSRGGGGLGSALGGLHRSVGSAASILAPMAGLALTLGPVGAAAVGLASGFGLVKKSMSEAAQTQTLQSSFVTLLGSMDAAKKRMAAVSKFAADTPFEIPSVAKASKVLQTLTQGALATVPGLTLVGDAAAVSGEPIDQLSVHIGRLYDGLMNGRPVGEALARLQELGLVSSNTRTKIEQMQSSGQKGSAVWTLAARDLGRFSGEMKQQSSIWSGMLSNASDAIGQLFRAFGSPVISYLAPYLQKLVNWLGTLNVWAEKAGTIFAGWSALIAQLFVDGKMGAALEAVGKIAFMNVVNFLAGALTGIGNVLFEIFGGVARAFIALLMECTTADFWKGLGNALKSAGQALMALLLEAVSKILDAIAKVPGLHDQATKEAAENRAAAAKFTEGSAQSGARASSQLDPLLSKFASEFARTMQAIPAAFTAGKDSAGNMFDTSGATAALMKIVHPSALAAQALIQKANAAASVGGLPAAPGTPGDESSKAKKDNIAGLQKIGGGGGFSLSSTNPQVVAINNTTRAVKELKAEIKAQKPVRYGQDHPNQPIFAY